MSRPTTRDELLERLDSEFDRLMALVDSLEPDQRRMPGACEDWSVTDLLAHLDAWHEMLLTWEREGAEGGSPAMPAPGYTWAQLPALNQAIWERTHEDPTDEVVARLRDSHARIRAVIERYRDEDLFTKRRFAWTGTTSVGSYAVSATTSHYDWARGHIRRFRRTRVE